MNKRILIYATLCLLFVASLFSGGVDAANVAVISNKQTVTSSGTERKYEDYQFKVRKNGKLNISFKHENLYDTEVYWTIEVLADDMETVLQTIDITGVATSVNSASLGLSAGKYYIRVWARKDCGHKYSAVDYKLKPTFTTADNWEVEYNATSKKSNDEQVAAKAITANKKYYGTTIDSRDVDFFKIKIKSKGYVILNIKHKNVLDADTCWNMQLVDDQTNVIASVDSLGTKKSTSTPKIGLNPGTYYIKVSAGRNYNVADYGITVKYTKASNWESEFRGKKNNNELITANPIKYGKAVNATLATEDDVDCFSVKIPSARRAKVAIKHKYVATQDSFYVVTVYNSKLNEMATITSKGVNSTASKSINFKKGTYYIKVQKGSTYKSSDYSVIVK